MIIRRLIVGSILSVLLAQGVGQARSQGIARPIDWQACMDTASRQNAQLLSALHGLEASQYQYSGSFNALMPQISLTNSYANSDTLANTGKFTNANNWSAGANASLSLFNAQSFATIKTDEAQKEQALANVRLISAGVRLSLHLSFINALYYQQKLDVDRQIVQLQKNDAEMVTLEYTSGQESKGNMLTAKAQLLQAEVVLSYDRLNLRAAEIALDQQLGQDEFNLMTVTGTFEVSASTAQLPDFASLVGKNPQIAVSKAGVVLAKAGLSTSEVSLWPSLMASGSRYYNGHDEFPQNPHWSVGATLSLPIFGNGPTAFYYQISASKKSLEQAQQSLRAAQEQARSTLENDWQNVVQTKDLVEVDRQLLVAAQLRNDESTVRYNTGQMLFETWILAVNGLVSAEQGLLNAQQNAAQAQAQWENAQGLILGE